MLVLLLVAIILRRIKGECGVYWDRWGGWLHLMS